MKKVLLFAGLLTFGSSFAQNCTKLMISEYVEGTGSDKAIEIYNPTNQTIDLSNYVITRFRDATENKVKHAFQLTGTIAPNDVYVAVLDIQVQQGNNPPISAEIAALADGFYCNNYDQHSALYFNGDDPVALYMGTLSGALEDPLPANLVLQDVIGQFGTDPGVAWTSIAPYNTGLGAWLTKGKTLRKKQTVMIGDLNMLDNFNALEQYDSLPKNTLSGLGNHICNCDGVSAVSEQEKEQVLDIFPNPSNDGVFKIVSPAAISGVTVFNALGQIIINEKHNGNTTSINLSNTAGVYLVKIETAAGVVTKRVIVTNK
jgi:hypothetical protein